MALAIKVENLSKAYQLGEIGTGTLSRDLERWVAKVRGKEDPFLKIGELNDRTQKGTSDIVWSLKDLNFEIAQGDAVGVIGRNGAGKSTLLKILSRVTSPTRGSVKVKGRIASLLEVGTGFHPELTGRENIFLNGAILGMSKNEIKKKFDDIVDFSGVERYIDTPVKRFSSGMYVRLAFAVAAYLESEILIIDEVLAVGDAEFQKKCLGKMEDVTKGEGRTILFVSHNMGAINQLCTKAIFLSQGKMAATGGTDKIITQYLTENNSNAEPFKVMGSNFNKKANFDSIGLKRFGELEYTSKFSIGDSIEFLFNIRVNNPNETSIKTAIELKTSEGIKLCNMIDVDSEYQVTCAQPGLYKYKVTLRDIRLYPGVYFVSFYIGDMSSVEAYDYLEDTLSFEVLDGGQYTTRVLPRSAGLLFLTPEWEKIM